MANFTRHKRGDSFQGTLVWTPTEGDPATLEGWYVQSSILDANSRRHVLEIANPSLDFVNYTFEQYDTSEWAVGDAYWDVKYSHPSGITRTNTWTFNVTPQVTL